MKRILSLFVLLVAMTASWGQSGFYIQSAKPVRNMNKALVNAPSFSLLICYGDNDSTFSLAALDLLDSAYRMAFNENNPMLYTMMIEGYGGVDAVATRARVDEVLHYFSNRCHAPFPVRNAYNKIHCSCHGDTVERIRFEVPVSLKVYDCNAMPESRLLLNKTISLKNSVLVTFSNNPAECIGMANGCFLPAQDSIIRGYYASLTLAKGSVYAMDGTKDSCPPPLHIDIEEHLDYDKIVERYFLVPHARQIIAQAGYIVLKSNFVRKLGECELDLPDSIFLHIPVSQEQVEGKVKVYGKRWTEKGPEYKTLTSRKVVNKTTGAISLQVTLNATLLDTLFLGKKVKVEDMTDYFYPVDSDREEGTITVKGKYYKAYRMNRRGEYESKKALRALMHKEIKVDEEKERKAAGKAVVDEEEIEEK